MSENETQADTAAVIEKFREASENDSQFKLRHLRLDFNALQKKHQRLLSEFQDITGRGRGIIGWSVIIQTIATVAMSLCAVYWVSTH